MIEADLESVFAFMSKSIAGLKDTDSLLLDGARIGKDAVEYRITHSKTSPDGQAWSSWMENTALYREHKGNAGQGLLWDSGDLLESFHVKRDGRNAMKIDSDVDYGQYLQDGTRFMAARPFMGWSQDDEQLIHAHFIAWVEKNIL